MDRKKRALAAAAIFLILAIFSGTAIAATAEDLARSAGNLNPGKVGKITGPPYSISVDTVVIQRIKVVDDDTNGHDLSITKVIVDEAPNSSATIEDLAQVALLDEEGKILALTKADATGLSFPITFDGERSITGIATPGLPYLIPDGGNAIFQIAVVVAAHPTDKHTLQVQTSIRYEEGETSGIVSPDPVRDGAAETIRDAGLEEVSDKREDAGRIVAGNSATVQKVEITDNDATYWDVKVTGVKVENQGSATSQDISLIEVLDKDGHVIGSDKPDQRFDFAYGGFRIGLSHTIPDDTSASLQIRVTLASNAREGRTIQLKAWIEQEEPAGFRYPDGVAIDGSPESIVGVTGDAKLTIGSDTCIKDAREPLTLYISIGGFPTPGLKGLQVGPQRSLLWNPSVIQVTKIEGVSPYTVRGPQIDNKVGKATFTLSLNAGATPLTAGKIIKLTIKGRGSAKAGDRTRIALSYDILRDNNDNDVFAAVIPGEVKIGVLGDVDFDNAITINDAMMVARSLLGLQDLTAEQQKVADFNQDGEIDSTDVRLIAEQSLAEASGAGVQGLFSAPSNGSAIGLFSSLMQGFAGLFSPAAAVTLAQQEQGFTLSIDPPSGVAAAGIQGWLSFRPRALQIEEIRGLNGWTVWASSIDNRSGRVGFLALRLSPGGGGAALQFGLRSAGAGLPAANLALDALIDAQGQSIRYQVYIQPAQSVAPFHVEEVSLWPNPLLSGNATIFTARGSGIAGLEVRVFDLTGRTVSHGKTDGGVAQIEFQAMNNQGQPLANGVYLYLVTVRGTHGQLYRSKLGKLVVLR